MKTKIVGKKVLSVLLSIAILLGVMPIAGLMTMAASTTGTIADPHTIDVWKNWLTDDSSRYAGGVFVDKSVFTSEGAKDYFENDIADKLKFGKDNFGNENFLVALSGIGSNTEIKGYSSVPTDTMLVLDLSNSMSNNEVSEMVTSTNRAIERLLELNNYNRVGVVLYSGNSYAGNSSASTGTVILPLGRYVTDITETEDNKTHNVYLTSSGNSVSVANRSTGYFNPTITAGVKAEGGTEYITGSKSASGATYMQNGIYLAYKQFEAAPDKVIPEGQIQAGTKRVPILVLMGDGAPTVGTTNYNDVNTSNVGNGTSESTRLSFLTQLTAAWTKAKMASLYGQELSNAKLYTLGLGVSNNQNAADVLNPSNANSNTIDMWDNFINDVADKDGDVEVSNDFDVPKDTTGMLTSTEQRHYVTDYKSANDAQDMVEAFEKIVSEIINQSKILQDKYYSTLVDGNAETDGYISFTDEIGTYMEVKDMKGVHIGKGTLVTGDMFAEHVINDKIIAADGTLTELGSELISALESRFNVNNEAALTLINNAVNNGYIHYTNEKDFSNYVAWYADANNNYIAPYNELARTSAPQNAKYIMKSYIYLGDVTQNYVETSMMYTLIRVKEDIATGRQSVDANLPAALLPMVTYSIEINGEELTAESIKGMTNNASEKSPATLLYEVGLRDDITPYNISEKVTEDFRKNADGTYSFYTNRWRDNDGNAFTVPQTPPENIFNHNEIHTSVTHFVPSLENTRYYYTEDTLIYEKDGSSYKPYTGSSAPTGGNYYHAYNYVEIEGGAAKFKTVYNPITENAILKNKQVGNNWYIKAGTVKSYFSYLEADSNVHSDKADNKTGTLSWHDYPAVAYHASEGHNGYHVVNYLGNNGKLTVAAAQGIKLTKTVTETVDGASNSFTFNIALSGTTIASSYPYRLEKADGTVETGSVAVVNGNIQHAIGAGDVLYITGLPTDTEYTVTEQYSAYYVASSTNAKGKVEEYTINAVDFVNSPRGYGSLLVEKDVTHPFVTNAVPQALINKEFDITVTFSGNANDLANIVAPAGVTKVSDSVYTLKLSDGEDVLFTNIPETVKYVVTENLVNANKGDKDYGFKLVTDANDLSGTIVKNTESTALLVNDYEPDSVTPDIILKGTKNIPNYDDTVTEYQIALQQVDIGGNTSVNVGAPIIIDAIKEGETYSYNMGAAITYTEVGTYTYEIYEVEPADGTVGKPANIAYDKSFALFAVNVTDNNADGVLEIEEDNVIIHRQSAEFDTSANTTTIVKNFENLYEAGTVSFDMQKTINGSSDDHVHDSGILFGLFADPTETTSGHNPLYYALTDDNGNATISFNILKGDYATAKYYYVREISPDLNDRVVGMTYDTAFKYVVEVVWTGVEPEVKYYNYDASAQNGLGIEIASTANKPDSALAINNNYDDSVTSKPEIVLSGEKTLNGRSWKQGDKFVFELYETGADFSTTGLTPVQTAETTSGAYEFAGRIIFDTPGVKYLLVKEQKGNAGGITYDITEYHITVNVVKSIDANGKTILSVSQNDGGSLVVHKVGAGNVSQSELDFVNSYTVTDTEKVKIYGTKELTGRTLVAGGFKFELYEEGGSTPLYTVANTASGSFEFPELTFTEAGEHTYTVKEYIPADKKGITYDTKTYEITVTLTDDTNGGLTKTVKLDGATVTSTVNLGGIEASKVDVLFRNSYLAEGTSITLSGVKTLEGRKLTDNDKFTFELYEANKDFIVAAGANPIKTAQNDKDTDYSGSYEMTLNYADGDEGMYYYILAEKIPQTNKKGIGFDTRDYHITVMVVDDGAGKMIASVVGIECHGIEGNFTSNTLNFSNIYKAAPVEYTVSGEKDYNKTLDDDMFSFELSYEGSALETVKNKADEFEFAPVELTTAGTHTLTVKEVNGGSTIKGIKYDSTVYTIKLTVVDNGEGQLVITEELINNSANTDIKFSNTYSADATDAIKLSGNKKLDANGREIKADEFTFELYEADEDYNKKGEAVKSAKNNANGLFTFDKELKFTKAQDYYYVVVEKDLGAERMSYDKTVFGVKITVTDNGEGKLVAADPVYVAISGNTEKAANGIEFNNTYTPKATDYTIGGEKKLKGRDLKADEFEFELYEGEGRNADKLIETVKNDKDGKFEFKKLNFNEAKSFKYTVVEKKNGIERVTYDESVYTVTIKVKANSNGDFVIDTVTYDKGTETDVGGIEFENTYTPKPDDIKVLFDVNKKVKNTGSEKLGPEDFEFVLENITKNEKNTVKSDKDGKAEFELTFTEDDIGKTYEYKLSEVKGDKANVTYSEEVYNISVAITLSDKNVIVATATVGGKEVKDVVAEFENVYNYTPAPTPEPDDEPEAPAPVVPESPKTGDSTNLMLWIAVFFVSVTGIFTTTALRKKSKTDKE